MSNTTLNALNKNNTASATDLKNIKSYLIRGAFVDFASDGSEMVYTINGVDDLKISENGYVIDKGVIKHPKDSNNTVYIGRREGWDAINISYNTLITLLNGYIPRGGLVIDKRDELKGWSPDNIMLVNKFTKEPESFSELSKVGIIEDEVKEPQLELFNSEELYSRKETISEFVTEDFAVFPTRELAEWHQNTLTEAKSLAQVVLDYNGGYGIAEKVYQEKVVYNKQRPYENFRDVMDNNAGIVERKSKEVVKFNSFTIGGEPKFAYLFSEKSYNQDVADEIVRGLSQAREIFEKLEGLSKQAI